MVGNLPFDIDAASDHDIHKNQFWTIYPSNKVICSAKAFVLTHILFIAELGKPKNSSILSNPNTKVILNLYEYNLETKMYYSSGRSALLHASSTLHINVTKHIIRTPDGITLSHKDIPELSGYEPFHLELDLTERIPSSSTPISDPSNRSEATENDIYIVEKIEKKRYNSKKVQYEYFIKWLGYSSKENTWELPSNIPADMLDQYERSILDPHSTEPRRAGLRDRSTIKSTSKPDFILNM